LPLDSWWGLRAKAGDAGFAVGRLLWTKF